MHKLILSILFFFYLFFYHSQETNVIDVYFEKDSSNYLVVNTEELFFERWDTLPQPIFWKKIMKMSPDSCVINVASSRQILGYESFKKWISQTENEKSIYKDSVREVHGFPVDTKIYVTSGKNEFYNVYKTLPSISKAIEIFQDNNTDPWYSQAILLIESPGRLQYSTAGAYGPFQLMKSVARAQGLIVNKQIDERKDFAKSAKAASSLIQKTCIPEADRILTKKGIEFKKTDLWFKFLVLHIYHAGAGNVEGLLDQMETSLDGMELITWIWQNEWGGFKNASQNYSQVAIAALLYLHDEVYNMCDYIFECRVF